MSRVSGITLAIVSTFLVWTPPVSAQMFGTIAGQTAMNNVIMANVNQRGQRNAHNEDKRKSTTPQTPQMDAADFSYSPSKRLRDKNIKDLAASLSKTDPQAGEKLNALHAQSDVISSIDQRMRTVGLRADNVADAYTIWWISAWEAVNNQDMGSSRQLFRSVKNQIEGAIGNTALFSNMSNAQKQVFSESLLLQAFMIDSAKQDPSMQAQLPQAVNQGAKRMGLDLTKMTLTNDGFVPRTGGRSDAADGSGDTQLAANDAGGEASDASFSNYALYAAAGTGLLVGVFAIAKGISRRG